MPDLIDKITGAVQSTTGALTILFGAVAVCALIVLAIAAAASPDPRKRLEELKNVVWVLVVCVVAAFASGLVTWAMTV